MDLDDPRVDFVRLAESLGVRAERIDKASDIGPALTRAIAGQGPTLLDVELVQSKLFQRFRHDSHVTPTPGARQGMGGTFLERNVTHAVA